MTDPFEFVAPDDNGTAAIVRFGFQASVALRFVLRMLGGSDVLHVTCEHFEDVVVGWSGPNGVHWDFQQVKSRDSGEAWTLAEVAESGLFKSLLRTDRALRRHAGDGRPVDYRLTAAIEGGLKPGEPDLRELAHGTDAVSSDRVIWLAGRLGAEVSETADFLRRVYVEPWPRRDLLERDNKDALRALSSHLTVGEIREVYQRLCGMVWDAMAGRLAPEWQRLIVQPSPPEAVLRKRLTLEKLAEVRLRLQHDELFDFLESSSRADGAHPYFLATAPAAPSLADVRVPLRIVATDDRPATLATAIGDPCVSVIVAGPGGGKTSLLRLVQAESARRWIAGDDQDALAVVVPAASLVGRPLSAGIAGAANESLSAVGLRRTLSEDLFRKPPRENKRWLVLVDGVDEITDTQSRREVLSMLGDKVASGPDRLYRFVVATRPLSIDETRPLGSVPEYRLLPFSNNELMEVVRTWFECLCVDDPVTAATRFVEVIANAGMAEFARVPLMAALLCQVHAADPLRDVPRSRSELYARFIGLASARMNGPGGGGIRRQSEAMLGRFGSHAMDRAETLLDEMYEAVDQLAGDERADSGDRSIEAWVARLMELPAGRCPQAVPAESWEAFLASVLRRCGLFVSSGRELDFLHRTLQEFCAARYAKRTVDTHVGELTRVLKPWRESQAANPNPWGAPLFRASYIAFLLEADSPELHRRAVGCLASILGPDNLTACLLISILHPFGVLDSSEGQELVRKATEYVLAVAGDQDGDPIDRAWAAEVLTDLDQKRGIEMLTRLTEEASLDDEFEDDAHDPDASVRLNAAKILMSVDRRRGAEAFLALAYDPDLIGACRVRAAHILLQVRDSRALAALEALVEDDDLLYIDREDAALALADHDRRRGFDAYYTLITEFQDDPDWGDYALDSARTLAHLGDPRGARLVEELERTGRRP